MKEDTLEQHLIAIHSLVKAIARGDSSQVDAFLQFTNGNLYPKLIADLFEQVGLIIVQNEVREFRLERMIEDLLHAQVELEQAKHDVLTGLPNRAMFYELLTKHCSENREQQNLLALMLIDLDKFKHVNDTMGHDAGDEILQQVSERLKSCVGDSSVVARLGGDEFTAILPGIPSAETAQNIGVKIVRELARPFTLKAGVAHIGASIGLTFFPKEADTPISLLKNADIAMYKAKESGRNHCQLYRELLAGRSHIRQERDRRHLNRGNYPGQK
ncbi:MAG: GGDEF domain-containing protein [Pseudomonadota bacterium]